MTRIYKNVLALLGIFIVLFSGTMYYQIIPKGLAIEVTKDDNPYE